MQIRNIESLDEARTVFPILKEMRTDLNETTYLERLQGARSGGYVLVGAFDGETCVGLMGYRFLTDFVHGKHLYVDDLVVTKSVRSKGLGRKLLEFAKSAAEAEGCQRLRLCTGVDNADAKVFYEKIGWQLKAVVYKTTVS